MTMINQNKPISVVGNFNKTSTGETWASISTTWASEIRTWSQVSKLINNQTKGTAGFLWSNFRFPWMELTPWITTGGMINEDKPI